MERCLRLQGGRVWKGAWRRGRMIIVLYNRICPFGAYCIYRLLFEKGDNLVASAVCIDVY